MSRDLVLPDIAADDEAFAEGVRRLRDHLVGAVDVDLTIALDGRAYRIAWADRRPVTVDETSFWVTTGLRVAEGRGGRPPEVLPTGEEQISLVVDGERLVFHLMALDDPPVPLARPRPLPRE